MASQESIEKGGIDVHSEEAKDFQSFTDEYVPDDIHLLAPALEINNKVLDLQAVRDKFRKKDPGYYEQIATRLSVFEDPDPELSKKYFPTSKWENFKAFDPYFRWTVQEDIATTKRIDWTILPIVCALFFALNLDRGNLGSAIAGGMLTDLKLTTDQYNMGNNLRSIGFIITEIPSQMVGKRFGPDWWMPAQVVLWSIVAFSQFWMNDYKSYYALRFLLGVAQGGFIADSVQYISYFYTRDQLGFRLSIFWFFNSVSGVLSSLLSVGFLKVHLHGIESWKWLFLFDGIITLFLGILSFFFMVPGPTQTKTRLFPQGYFTERQEKIISNRLIRDDPTKSDMHNREAIGVKQFFKTLSDYDLWPLLILSFVFQIPLYPMQTYLNISLKELKFSTDEIIYLNIPIEVLTGITLIALTLFSEFVNERSLVSALPQIWVLVCVIVEYTSVEKIGPWGQYAINFFVISMPNAQAIIVSWLSRVSYSVRARTITSPMSNIGIQLAGLVGQNIYRSDDAPHYYRGNRVLIGICCMNIVLFVLSKVYYIYRNKQKRAIWDSLNESEKEQYVEKHRFDGNKRADFLFEH